MPSSHLIFITVALKVTRKSLALLVYLSWWSCVRTDSIRNVYVFYFFLYQTDIVSRWPIFHVLDNTHSLFIPLLFIIFWSNKCFLPSHLMLVIKMISHCMMMVLKVAEGLLLVPKVWILKVVKTLDTLEIYTFRQHTQRWLLENQNSALVIWNSRSLSWFYMIKTQHVTVFLFHEVIIRSSQKHWFLNTWLWTLSSIMSREHIFWVSSFIVTPMKLLTAFICLIPILLSVNVHNYIFEL